MKNQFSHMGAALYVPANHPDLAAILRNEKLSVVKTIVICLEDAIAAHEYVLALAHLQSALAGLSPEQVKPCFLRPRNIACFIEVFDFDNARDCFCGAVLPKFSESTFEVWSQGISRLSLAEDFKIMPTLETIEVFDVKKMQMLAKILSNSVLTSRVPAVRIGGNDLLSLLNLRRPRGKTIYETPLGTVISQLATTFIPAGFNLSAPVFEYFSDIETLKREIVADLDHGLVGKTAIHPQQVTEIEAMYSIPQATYEEAKAILQPQASGVFNVNDAMCEPETHRNWANKMIAMQKQFGTKNVGENDAI